MTARINKEPVTTYSSVARGLLSPSMDENTKSRIMKKFDISFVIAKECLLFTKYLAMHELEERHGVDLGQAYKTRESAHKFVHYKLKAKGKQCTVVAYQLNTSSAV